MKKSKKEKECLTAKQVQFMKPDPAGRRLEVPAGPPVGLYLVVHPSGTKSWYFRYRFGGRTRVLSFEKHYPDLLLAGARAEAEAAVELLRDGKDPAVVKIEERIQAAEAEKETERDTVERVVKEWLERDIKKRTRTAKETERYCNKEILPKWRDRLITDIRRSDVLRLLDAIVDRGHGIAANRTLNVLRRLFNWCMQRGLVEASPVAGLKPPCAERSRDRVLTDGELIEVWNAAGAMEYPFGPFVRLLILTGQRRNEVAGVRWPDLDLEGAVWTLPRELTKANRAHFVPLPALAVGILKGLPVFEGPFTFTTTSGNRPISGFSRCKTRIDDLILKARKKAGNHEPMPGWTIHDLRRTFATGLAGLGIPPHILALMLNHSPGRSQGITAIYNRFRYEKERRQAAEAWANHVLDLVEPRRKEGTSGNRTQ